MGGILHKGFDLFYKGMGDQDVYQFIADRFTEELNRQEVSDQEDILVNKYTALGMWHNYPHKNLKEYDNIVSEEEFRVPLAQDINLIGKVDGRISQFGNWWVRELKTTGLSMRQFEGRCQTSGQGTGYVYGLIKQGYPIKGIMYEYIMKPRLRKGVKESADDFGRRIMRDYKDRPKMYFNRHLSYRTPVDLELFQKDMIELAHDITNTINTTDFYRNVDQCWNYNTECPYAKICFAKEPDPLTLELYFEKEVKKDGRASESVGENGKDPG